MPIRMEDAVMVNRGIKGQKWGVRNGPPYPLDAATSAKVKAGAKSEVGHVGGVETAALTAGSVLKSLGIENSEEMRDFVCREGLLYDDDQDFD